MHISHNSLGFSVNQLDGPSNGSVGKGQNSTKVLYFTDKTVNPCMCTIHKRFVCQSYTPKVCLFYIIYRVYIFVIGTI